MFKTSQRKSVLFNKNQLKVQEIRHIPQIVIDVARMEKEFSAFLESIYDNWISLMLNLLSDPLHSCSIPNWI